MTMKPPLRIWARWALVAGLLFGSMGRAAGPPTRLVDLHIHFDSRPGFVEDLVKVYSRLGAIACTLADKEDFEKARDAARRYPDIIYPFAAIDLDAPDAVPLVDRAKQAGFRGVKFHSPMKNYDDPSYFPIFARAERYRMVALFHTGISYRPNDKVPRLVGSCARMRPMYLDTLARAFPELKLVGAHLGNPWYEEAAEVARWNPNVYFDVTGSTLIKKKDELNIFRKYLWWGQSSGGAHMPSSTPHAFEKLVFGTDEEPGNLEQVLARYTALMDACQVSTEVRHKVFVETGLRLLGLPGTGNGKHD
jgi:uncharacterized protein